MDIIERHAVKIDIKSVRVKMRSNKNENGIVRAGQLLSPFLDPQ